MARLEPGSLGFGVVAKAQAAANASNVITTDGGVQIVTDGGISIAFETMLNPSVIMTGNSNLNGQGGSLGTWPPQDGRVTFKDYNPNPVNPLETTTVLGPRVNDGNRIGAEVQLCNGLATRMGAGGSVNCAKHGKNGSVMTDFLAGGTQNAKFLTVLADVAATGRTTHYCPIHQCDNEASGAGDPSMQAHVESFIAMIDAALPGTVYYTLDLCHPGQLQPGGILAPHGAAINASLIAVVAGNPRVLAAIDPSVPFPDGVNHDPTGVALHYAQDQYLNLTGPSWGKVYLAYAKMIFNLG